MKKYALLLALSAALASVALPARADTLDQILDAALPLIDPDLAQARPFVRCVVAAELPTPQACAAKYAKGKALSATAGNSKLNDVVAIVKAIQKHDWIAVLERAGTDLLVKLACSAGMPPAGPLKSFLCSSVSGELAKLAKPVLKTALEAVRDGNWPKLMAAVPTLACQFEVIPTAFKATVCTGLDMVLKGGLAAFNAMVNGLANEVSSLLSAADRLLGWEVKKSPPKEYFVTWWIPNLHKGVWLKMGQGESGFSALVNERVSACAQYYGTSSPCGPMKTVFTKAVDTAVAALKAGVPLYYEAKTKPDLFFFYLFWADSKGKETGFFHKYSKECEAAFLKQVPIPECDGFPECRPRPTAHLVACSGVEKLLLADIQKMAPLLDQKLAALRHAGCTVKSPVIPPGISCTTYAGGDACVAALPGHSSVCILDQWKAAGALADEILKKLGSKRCRHPGSSSPELATVECTRPWKTDECKSLAAAGTPPNVSAKAQCSLKLDPAFEPERARARQVLAVLNSGQAMVPTGGGAAIMVAGSPIRFRPGGCALAHPDPLKLHCAEWDVVKDVASKVPALNLKACPPDPKSEGVDEACYQAPTTLGPPGPVVAVPVLVPAPPPPTTGRVAGPTPPPGQARN